MKTSSIQNLPFVIGLFTAITTHAGPHEAARSPRNVFDLPIVCQKTLMSGQADMGLSITVSQPTPVSWMNLAQIKESGVLGPRVIDNVNLPLRPTMQPLKGTPYVNLIYRGQGLSLALTAKNQPNFPLIGRGKAVLSLPGYARTVDGLDCVRVGEGTLI